MNFIMKFKKAKPKIVLHVKERIKVKNNIK